jgi:hypothetical protein
MSRAKRLNCDMMTALRLFQAGLVAASAQLIAVGLTTFVALEFLQHNDADIFQPGVCSGTDCQSIVVLRYLKWGYLLTACGVVFTGHRIIDATASRIRHGSRAMWPTEPDRATERLLSLLIIPAIGFAVCALSSPPTLLIALGRHFACACAASFIWSGTMSIAAASFGANARAANRALRR